MQRIKPKKKRGFEKYLRYCKHCKKLYTAELRKSRVCNDCKFVIENNKRKKKPNYKRFIS